MQITLKKPIKAGQSRTVTITTANGVGRQPNGGLVRTEVLDGDSSAPTVVDAASNDKKITLKIHGDGSLGEKKVRLHLDTQTGKAVEGKPVHRAAQDVDITYTVVCAECDTVQLLEVEADEDLPANFERSYMRH